MKIDVGEAKDKMGCFDEAMWYFDRAVQCQDKMKSTDLDSSNQQKSKKEGEADSCDSSQKQITNDEEKCKNGLSLLLTSSQLLRTTVRSAIRSSASGVSYWLALANPFNSQSNNIYRALAEINERFLDDHDVVKTKKIK